MLERFVHFIAGAVLAAGGGYLAWTQREGAAALFPPTQAGLPWLLVSGVALFCAGLVFVGAAVVPRPRRAARRAAEIARREQALAAADAYYARRARAADRTWRSGDLPPAAEPAPFAKPQTPEADEQGATFEPASPPRPAAKPVATSVPPDTASLLFPSNASLAPIPKSADPPPPPASAQKTTAPGPASPPAFSHIRAAINEGRLDEADRLLAAARETAGGVELAELTGLAGDHAAASGRLSNAKWLWRLALKRFGEAGAMEAQAAREVAERLRLADA